MPRFVLNLTHYPFCFRRTNFDIFDALFPPASEISPPTLDPAPQTLVVGIDNPFAISVVDYPASLLASSTSPSMPDDSKTASRNAPTSDFPPPLLLSNALSSGVSLRLSSRSSAIVAFSWGVEIDAFYRRFHSLSWRLFLRHLTEGRQCNLNIVDFLRNYDQLTLPYHNGSGQPRIRTQVLGY